jgi:helicase
MNVPPTPGWRPLDHLLLLILLHDRSFNLRRHSKQLDEIVDGWLESHSDEIPVLYKWIRGQDGHSKADEIIGSLGIKIEKTGKGAAEYCRKLAYQALFHAIVLMSRSQGAPTRNIEREFGVKGLEGIEEQWRDNFLWLLSGTSRIMAVRPFFYHLKQECSADLPRIRRVETLSKRCAIRFLI